MTNRVHVQDRLFRLTGVGVVQTDMQTGCFMRASRTFSEMLGYSEAELQNMTYQELTHPDDRERDAESFAGLQRGEHEGGTSLTRALHKDGTVVWLELNIIVIREGDQAFSIAVVNDATEHKRVEAALQRSEQRFSRAFQVGPVAACITTLDKETFLEVNDAFLALTSYERDEVVGKTSRELGMWSSPEDRQKLSAAQRDGQSYTNLELKLCTKEGSVRDILISAAVIQLDTHHGYLKMFYDITERKQTKDQLISAIQDVMGDAAWFSQRVIEKIANVRLGEQSPTQVVDLSKREREVLEHIARGANNERIAADLGIAVQTVRNYISTIYDKLGVHSRGEAIIWARERGITGP